MSRKFYVSQLFIISKSLKNRLLYSLFEKISEIGHYQKNKLIIKEILQLMENYLIYAEKKDQNIFE